jgi:1,4-dihydroxy-2-naphthoate polyprenyltransferase
MAKRNSFSIWMAQIRANFLLLSVFLVMIGLAAAYKYQDEVSSFNWLNAFLLVAGVVSTHISVNLFNEYSDFKTGIDNNTPKTPFSGGTGMLTRGLTKPGSVLRAAIITLLTGLAVGIYFTFKSHWTIIILAIIGGLTIVLYTEVLAKYMLGEFFCGLTLGTFVVLGTYIAMNASPGQSVSDLLPFEVILISIPPGILTLLLLFLNEFPDFEADRAGGRNHIVIRFGLKKSAFIYITGLIATFGIIVIMPLAGISSFWLYLALIPLPFAVKAGTTALRYNGDFHTIVPALGQNVMTVLGVDLLLAVGVFISI